MLKENIQYKPASSVDAEQVVSLIQNNFDPNQLVGSIYLSPNICSFFVNKFDFLKNEFFTCVFLGKNIIGYLHAKEIENNLHLNMICVDSNFRSKKIGSTLYQIFEEACLKNKKNASLDVNIQNKHALNWYQEKGFRTVKFNERYLLEIKKIFSNNIKNKFIFQPVCIEDILNYGFGYLDVFLENKFINKLGIILPNIIAVTNDNLGWEVLMAISSSFSKYRIMLDGESYKEMMISINKNYNVKKIETQRMVKEIV